MSATQCFANRSEAGRELAREVARKQFERPLVVALPRGGVPVALEIARTIGAPLELVFVRKIGVPGHSELAAAAVVDGGEAEMVLNEGVLAEFGLTEDSLHRKNAAALLEIERRRRVYATGQLPRSMAGRTVIVVDDGLATGASMKAAIIALRRKAPKAIVVAVPVAPRDAVDELRSIADDVVCLRQPKNFMALGHHYKDFHQLSDAEVVELMQSAPAVD